MWIISQRIMVEYEGASKKDSNFTNVLLFMVYTWTSWCLGIGSREWCNNNDVKIYEKCESQL